MKKIDKLLKLLNEETINGNKPSDRTLFHLLSHWKDVLPKLDNYFHKAFRQTDVTESGHIDMAIWYLLNESILFWEIFERVQDRKKI